MAGRRVSGITTAAVLLLVVALAGCQVAPPRNDDPLERYNRAIHTFNDRVDRVVLRPVAQGYRMVVPVPARRSVGRFFANLRMPVTIVNHGLQGRPGPAVRGLGRLLVNSTIGVVGLFDPASRIGLADERTDLGVTLARWGVPEGPFVMLPLLGPGTPRDFAGGAVDGRYLDPRLIYARNHDHEGQLEYAPVVLDLIDLRAGLIEVEGVLGEVYDPYLFMRDAYRQRRLNAIHHGDPPPEAVETLLQIDDDGLDELLEADE